MKKLLLALSLGVVVLAGCEKEVIESKDAANYTAYLVEALEGKSPEFVENFEIALDSAGSNGDFEKKKKEIEKDIDSSLDGLRDVTSNLVFEAYKTAIDIAVAAIDFTNQKQIIDDFVVRAKETTEGFLEKLVPTIPSE